MKVMILFFAAVLLAGCNQNPSSNTPTTATNNASMQSPGATNAGGSVETNNSSSPNP